MICFNCKGNGFIRLNWEANESIEQKMELKLARDNLEKSDYYTK